MRPVVQVAVLFSPYDRSFADEFRQFFVQLDRLTGDKVAFFAVLDPPDDWLQIVGQRTWWRDYSRRIGRVG